MRQLAELFDDLRGAGLIEQWALFGALAQMRYTAPVATLDADVLVTMAPSSRLDLLAPIYAFCIERGIRPEGEALRVGDWPVQVVPAWDDLTRAAVETAETVDFEGAALRVVRADHLALLALSVGRAKDAARILALLEAGSVTRAQLGDLASRYGLGERWRAFVSRFLDG